MRLVAGRGTPVVAAPTRVAGTTAVGVDKTAFLSACVRHAGRYAAGIANLSPDRPALLLDVLVGHASTLTCDQKPSVQFLTAILQTPYRPLADRNDPPA